MRCDAIAVPDPLTHTHRYIFLERRREDDLPKIGRVCHYLLSADIASNVFIFPEGTDLSASNLAKAHQFAKDRSLLPLNHVLYPKTGGLATCLRVFRESKRPASSPAILHDITIGDMVHPVLPTAFYSHLTHLLAIPLFRLH